MHRVAEDRLNAEKRGQEAASTAFGKDNGALPNGFKCIAEEAATSAKAALDWESVRRELVDQKWVALKDYQEKLKFRHDARGSSLNYKERFKRITKFLSSDVEEAYSKSIALEKGLVKKFSNLTIYLCQILKIANSQLIS